jgi:hypothetical protein
MIRGTKLPTTGVSFLPLRGFALAVFSTIVSSSFCQAQLPEGVFVRFTDRMYDEQGYFHGFPVKGFIAWSGSYSRSNSQVTWFPHADLSGLFSDRVEVYSQDGGLAHWATFQATVRKESASAASDDETFLDIAITAVREGAPWTFGESLGGRAFIKCEIEITSGRPFSIENGALETNSIFVDESGGIQPEYLPAGVYTFPFEVSTDVDALDFSSIEVTNSVRVSFRFSKLTTDPPKIAAFKMEETRPKIQWNDVWDRAVRIQRNSSLTSTNWQTIGYGAIGQKSFMDTNAPTGSAFYRLVW